MARTLRELILLKEKLDAASLASMLLLARAEQRIIDAHLAVAELEWQEAQSRATLRAVKEVRERYLLNRALIEELEQRSN